MRCDERMSFFSGYDKIRNENDNFVECDDSISFRSRNSKRDNLMIFDSECKKEML